jgi:mycothiol synthase
VTLDFRPSREGDLPGIATLFESTLIYDRPNESYVRYLLAEDPDYDPGLIWVAEDAGRIAGVVVASLPDERLQCPGGIKLFAVAEEHRRQGVATRLFDLAEEALRAQGVTECVAVNCGHNRLTLGLDVRYTAALCLLLGRGYQQLGTSQDMSVPLVAPDAPNLDTTAAEMRLRDRGVVVRRARPEEKGWVCDGVAQTMAPPIPARRWAYLAEQAFRYENPRIEVAQDVNTGAFMGFAAYDAARWGALGPMGVSPDAQRFGLGGVLLKRCLRDMREDGLERAEIFSVGPIPFYAKTVDARISRVFYRYAKRF